MIFVSVGQMMPFDRLIRLVDEWAAGRPDVDVVAQVGEGTYEPRHIQAVNYLTPVEFREHVERADAVLSHAGTGNIFAALEVGKPLLIFPRQHSLREVTNDHQEATARFFAERGLLRVAVNEQELRRELDDLESAPPPRKCSVEASPELVQRLRRFIFVGD